MSFAICVFAEFSFLFAKSGGRGTPELMFMVPNLKFMSQRQPTFSQPSSCQRSEEVAPQLLLNGKVNIKVAPDE